MGKYAFIDNILGTDDEAENDDEGITAEDSDDDDEEDDASDDEADDESEEEDDRPVEDDAMLRRLDKEFRRLRDRIRASTDPSELRTIRNEHTASLAERQTPTVRLRTLDVIEAVDDRVTDLRARRVRSD